MSTDYRFSFGPWNLHDGADAFGPPVRPDSSVAEKLGFYRELGFEGVQFHDDDVVADVDDKSPRQLADEARAVKKLLDDHGLVAEFVAPRLWMDERGVDGAFTSNDPDCQRWSIDRAKRALDLCQILDTELCVLWLAREGTWVRESKDPIAAHRHLIAALDELAAHAPDVHFAIEPKPNEPCDQAYLPTVGHALALGQRTAAPERMGTLIESAHSLLANLDPADDMAFALALDKLYSVHLNDQNGLKFDQDKAFGAANLRGAFDQVRVLELANYAQTRRFVGLDVKALRTQRAGRAAKHLDTSRRLFLALVEKVRSFDRAFEEQCIAERDYEELERGVLAHLLSVDIDSPVTAGV